MGWDGMLDLFGPIFDTREKTDVFAIRCFALLLSSLSIYMLALPPSIFPL
jgi:hypothetical protein